MPHYNSISKKYLQVIFIFDLHLIFSKKLKKECVHRSVTVVFTCIHAGPHILTCNMTFQYVQLDIAQD